MGRSILTAGSWRSMALNLVLVLLQDVMKKKASEIEKSKLEARGGGGRLPASAMSISSSAMGSGSLGSRSTPGMDLDSGPSFNRYRTQSNPNGGAFFRLVFCGLPL